MTQLTTRTADDGRICDAVIDAVAAATDTDPLDLPQLYDVIDPDAIDRLFPHADATCPPRARLEFAYADCDVCIHGDGRVIVAPVRSDAPTRTASTA